MGGTWVRRGCAVAASALLGASLLVACGKKQAPAIPSSPILGVVTFDQNAAVARNGFLDKPNVAAVCGSSTATFGTELINSTPDKAKVLNEWGAIGEDTVAEQHVLARIPKGVDVAFNAISEPKRVAVAGTVQDFQLSTGDLTFNHPYGVDMTMDIKTDPVYLGSARRLGTGAADKDGPPPGTIHIEIQQGLVPHAGSGLSDFLPGFEPQNGDRIAAYGPWIIDCGHDDFHTELHELTFLAFGRASGNTTTDAHVFYNPYRQSQLLAARGDLTNDFAYWGRFADPSVKPFPPFLVSELLRVGHLKQPFHDRLEAHQVLKADYEPPPPWFVCAPSGGSGRLSYTSSFTVRPGVTITATPDESTGCVKFTAVIGMDYLPLTPARKDCVDPWSELNAQLQAALGNPNLDVKQLIEKQVPASFIPAVERDPIVDCYDPLQVAPPQLGQAGTHRIVTSATQPFPFYGEVRVAWGSST